MIVESVVRDVIRPAPRSVTGYSGLTIPRTDLLAYFRGGTDTIGESTMLLDQSGNGRHMTIVSGTGWSDWVLTAPVGDAAWIAADTGNIFYDSAGDPIEITIIDLRRFPDGNYDDMYFFSEAGSITLAVYDSSQSADVVTRIERVMRVYPWVEELVMSSADIVDVFVYDTSGDSDGGAWCNGALAQASSWYNETLNTATRGETRAFPVVALIVAETDKATIYDATDPDCPMWKVIDLTGYTVKSVAMKNGVFTAVTTTGLYRFDFISGDEVFYTTATSPAIINNAVNDVAMTVLDNAPIDQTTGLPVPTTTVATDGNSTYGLSLIAHDGNVYDLGADTTETTFVSVSFDGPRLTAVRDDGNVYVWDDVSQISSDGVVPDMTYSASTTPALLGTAAETITGKAIASTTGLTVIKEDESTPANGMVAYVTDSYNTGWMHGDIKGAFLADTVAETIGLDTTEELVTNGTFDTDTSGWLGFIGTNFTLLSVDTGRLKITSVQTGTNGRAVTTVTTVVGQVYRLSADYENGDAGGTKVLSFNFDGSGSMVGYQLSDDASGSFNFTFKAESTTTYIFLYRNAVTAGTYFYADNVSCKPIQNLVENGEFSGDRGWDKGTGWTISGGVASYSGPGEYLNQDMGVSAGQSLSFNIEVSAITGTFSINYYNGSVFQTLASSTTTGGFSGTITIPSDIANGRLYLRSNSSVTIDNVEVYELSEQDRSVNANYLQVVGELTKAPVATGSELVSYSGFSAANYLELTNADFADTLFACGWQYNGTAWEFKSGVVSTAPLDGVSITGTTLHIEGTYPKALIRLTNGTPSADQLSFIEQTEKRLFEENADCTLGGTSSSVQALSFDEYNDRLYASTADGTSLFDDLVRVGYIDSASGATTSDNHKTVSAAGGRYAIGTASETIVTKK